MDYDILIIGGGMVGASLALALAPSGLRVGVIEAVPYGGARQPSYDDRTLALAEGSQRIFATLGVWDRIAAGGATPIRRIHISDRGHFGFARLDAAEAGVEALGYVVENRALGAALLEALAGCGHASLITPAVMRAIAFETERVSVTVEQDGATRVLTARLVVAADGGDSSVREAAGIRVRRHAYGQTAVVTNISTELPHDGSAFERFTSSGPLALLPMSEGRCAVVWSLPPAEADRVMALDEPAFLAGLNAAFGDRLGAFVRAGRRHAYPLALTRVAEHVRPRLALIGNAAHTLHPVAGQGFNLGLRDVATLAQVLTEAVQAGADPGELTVLRRYADWRRRDNLAVSGFTDGLVRLFSNRSAPLAVARNLGLIAVDLVAPLKRALLRRSMGLAGRLPRLGRGLPL